MMHNDIVTPATCEVCENNAHRNRRENENKNQPYKYFDPDVNCLFDGTYSLPHILTTN